MKVKQLRYAFLATLVAVAVLDATAEMKGLYYTLWWFDIFTHFLGGMTVGFGSLWLGARIGFFPLAGASETTVGGITFVYEKNGIRPWATGLAVLVGISIVAQAWELREVIMSESFGLMSVGMPYPEGYVSDILSDLMMGFSGAIIAWAVSYKVKWIVWEKPVKTREAIGRP